MSRLWTSIRWEWKWSASNWLCLLRYYVTMMHGQQNIKIIKFIRTLLLILCLQSVIGRLQPPIWDEWRTHAFRHSDVSHPRSDIYEKLPSTTVNGRAVKDDILSWVTTLSYWILCYSNWLRKLTYLYGKKNPQQECSKNHVQLRVRKF
jgi:hypothetical protein